MAQNPTSGQVYAYNGAQSTGKGVIYDALGNPVVIGAQMPVGAAAGNVVTSDASGNLTLAAPAVVSGQFLCAPTSYAPGSRATPATSSATMAAVDSTNVNTGSFTAPASGKVLVTVSLVADNATSGNHMGFGLAEHGAVTPLLGNVVTLTNNASPDQYVMTFLVTGLTAGSSHNLDLLFCSADATAVTVFALGTASTTPASSGGPVLMTVQAV